MKWVYDLLFMSINISKNTIADKMKYNNGLLLPSGKLIDRINDIKNVSNVVTRTDKYSSPEKVWHEYDVQYIDNKSLTISYEVFATAAADRMFIVRFLNKI